MHDATARRRSRCAESIKPSQIQNKINPHTKINTHAFHAVIQHFMITSICPHSQLLLPRLPPVRRQKTEHVPWRVAGSSSIKTTQLRSCMKKRRTDAWQRPSGSRRGAGRTWPRRAPRPWWRRGVALLRVGSGRSPPPCERARAAGKK